MTINCSMFSFFFFRMTLLPTVMVLFKVFSTFIKFFFWLNYSLLVKHYQCCREC